MQIKFSSFIMIFTLYSYGGQDTEQLYSIPFLKNYKAVRAFLKNVGFTKTMFTTSDNFKLAGLFLSRPHARCNVILCAGWRPGRKEGLATFYDLLPEYCNILLFDARGRGQSEGSFLGKTWLYGIHEHKDIAAALSWINQNNQLPVIIIGFCSGAFNAMHTLIHLKKRNQQLHNVKGIVCDSGWGSIMEISKSAPVANVEECLIAIAQYFYDKKEIINHSPLFKIANVIAGHMCKALHFLLIKPAIKSYEPITNLFNKIHHLNIPIFFIHSYQDKHANIQSTIRLSKLAPLKKCWWIKNSYHTRHHLIHRDLYKEKIMTFINNIINEGHY